MDGEMEEDNAVPQEVVDLFVKLGETVDGFSHGDALIAMGLLIQHLADGDKRLIVEALSFMGNVALNSYSETMQ